MVELEELNNEAAFKVKSKKINAEERKKFEEGYIWNQSISVIFEKMGSSIIGILKDLITNREQSLTDLFFRDDRMVYFGAFIVIFGILWGGIGLFKKSF